MSEQQYQPISTGSLSGFLDGTRRIPRLRGARLNETQRAAVARREARVAAAAEFMGDILNGRSPAYFLHEAMMPRSPEVTRLIESNYPGLIRPAILQKGARGDDLFSEAMTTSDFPLLMGDVMDRMLLARFAEVPQVWREYISVGAPLRDFRTIRMLSTTGGNEAYDEIVEEEGVKYTVIAESELTMSPALYGKAMKLSWRLMQNDDLDAFSVIPRALAQGGRRTINKFATDLLFDANGPDATIFSAGNGNLMTGNPALSITSLGAALAKLLGFTDSTGEPISVEGVRLVYGPGLEVTVKNLLNSLAVRTTIAGGVTGGEIETRNWLAQGITPVMDPYIPAVVTGTVANAATSWLLVADPNAGRPIARVRFLQGFEQPVLYQKAPNTQRVGGGLDPDVGDFYSMSSEFKGLVAFGGVAIEPKAGVASNGSGS